MRVRVVCVCVCVCVCVHTRMCALVHVPVCACAGKAQGCAELMGMYGACTRHLAGVNACECMRERACVRWLRAVTSPVPRACVGCVLSQAWCHAAHARLRRCARSLTYAVTGIAKTHKGTRINTRIYKHWYVCGNHSRAHARTHTHTHTQAHTPERQPQPQALGWRVARLRPLVKGLEPP